MLHPDKKRELEINLTLSSSGWELLESNQRPSACKAEYLIISINC